MKIHVAKTAEELGAQAAHTIAEKLCEAIAESGVLLFKKNEKSFQEE